MQPNTLAVGDSPSVGVVTPPPTVTTRTALLRRPQSTFTISFRGHTLDEILPWAAEQVGNAPRVAVAMAGSGKDIAYLARPGRDIVSWDTQELSRLVVQGIFAQPVDDSEPLERGEAVGWCYDRRPFKGIPDDAALLVDWLAIAGTDLDRAALARALIRSTFQGRLTAWSRDRTADDLYDAYLRYWPQLAAWRALPGTFNHTPGSVFDHLDDLSVWEGRTVFVDTPKVVNRGPRGDIYSAGFVGLNSVLAQADQVLPAWTEDTYMRDMPRLFEAPWRRLLLFHTNDAKPGPSWVEQWFDRPGYQVVERKAWPHRGRSDLCWVVDR